MNDTRGLYKDLSNRSSAARSICAYLLLFALAAVACDWQRPVWAQSAESFTVDADYPGGNIIVERIEGDTVYLRPDLRDTQGWWFYWNFRVCNAQGRTLTFRFSGENPIGTRGPAVSVDQGKNWSWLGTDKVEEAAFTYSFAQDNGDVRFAFCIPYLEQNLKVFLAAHNSPYLKVEELCKTLEERSVERLHAGKLEGAARHRVLLTARHHACEASADYVMEGVLEAVLADDEQGAWYRRNVEVMAVPFMDKDGVEKGDQGKNRAPRDHNRDYMGPSIYASVAALRTFVPNWSNDALRVAVDLHCPYIRDNRNETIYLVGNPDERIWRHQREFARILEGVDDGPLKFKADDCLPFGKEWNAASNYTQGRGCHQWAASLDGMEMATSLEFPYANVGDVTVTPENARAFGRSLAKAICAYLMQLDDAKEKTDELKPAPVQIAGVVPDLTVMAKGLGSDSEAGIGALIPWADRLWAVGYVAHIHGQGIGLYEIDKDMTMRRHPASVTGTFANRMVHWPSGQAFIGPYAIDGDGNVRVIEALKDHRLCATCTHLTEPSKKVYMLGMEGEFWEVDVQNLEANLLFDLRKELDMGDVTAHFKSAYTAQGRVVVANNSYDEREYLGTRALGRLAEWDGKAWTIIERNPFVEVQGSNGDDSYGGNTLYATGWNRSSVILRALVDGQWQRYLLPKAGDEWSHTWNTEWMRIRHAQTERLLMDVHGMFYDLPPFAYGGHISVIRPISSHLRVVPDYCYWRGLFVMASDQIDHDQGQPQSGLWFGNIDDLWRMGKPAGWGGPWWKTPVTAGEVSDPFLMTGFDKKTLHLMHDSKENVRFNVEVDFLGDGTWAPYEQFDVPAGTQYVHHEFPDGFSAHWVRLAVDKACNATIYFVYN